MVFRREIMPHRLAKHLGKKHEGEELCQGILRSLYFKMKSPNQMWMFVWFPKIVGWYIVLVYNLIAYTTQPLSRYIKNNIWHLHTLSVDESQSLCRKFECRKDYYYKTTIYRPSADNECKCQILFLIYSYTSPALPSHQCIYWTRAQVVGNGNYNVPIISV